MYSNLIWKLYKYAKRVLPVIYKILIILNVTTLLQMLKFQLQFVMIARALLVCSNLLLSKHDCILTAEKFIIICLLIIQVTLMTISTLIIKINNYVHLHCWPISVVPTCPPSSSWYRNSYWNCCYSHYGHHCYCGRHDSPEVLPTQYCKQTLEYIYILLYMYVPTT